MHLIFRAKEVNMKKLIFLLIAITSVFQANAKNEEEHILKSLWASYYKAEREDRPQDQLNILESIRKEAVEKKLAWDLYDAGQKYVDVRSQIDWKTREESLAMVEKERKESGIAIIGFKITDDKIAFIDKHREELASTHTPAFYRRDVRITGYSFGDVLVKLLPSDLDYAYWAVGRNRLDRYPFNALHELREAYDTDMKKWEPKLKDIVSRHKGTAVALLAEDMLLNLRYNSLDKDSTEDEEAFKLLRNDCSELVRRSREFSGEEKIIADCIHYAKSFLLSLNRKQAFGEIKDGVLTVSFTNQKSARVRVYREGSSRLVWDRTVLNLRNSFYVTDSVNITLPDLDDGEYRVKIDKDKYGFTYSKHMLSVAKRITPDSHRIYVADARSGQPVERCDLSMYDFNDRQLYKLEDFALEGFTELPEDVVRLWDDGYLRISLTDSNGHLRSSMMIRKGGTLHDSRTEEEDRVTLITDRSAFNPGETMHFKAVLFKNWKELKAVGEGVKLRAVLYDAERKVIGSKDLTTNEFSSVEGSFLLAKGKKGGSYRLSIEKDGRTLGSRYITVDEFVLPSFSLEWEKTRESWLPGEEMEFKGRVFSFAGRNLSNAEISYTVNRNGDIVHEGPLAIDDNGVFNIRFASDSTHSYRSYIINVKVVEFSGETLEFSRYATVSRHINIFTDITNARKGFARRQGSYREIRIVNDEKVELSCRSEYPYRFKLTKDGKTLRSEELDTESFSIDMSGLAQGIYEIEFTPGDAVASRAQKVTRQPLSFYYAPEGTYALSEEVDCFFMEMPDEAAVMMGASRGPVWAVAELYGSPHTLLERRIVHIEGVKGEKSSLTKIGFEKKENYPSELQIELFFFKDYSSFKYTASYKAPAIEYRLPLSISRFTDKTLPGSTYKISIQTTQDVECAASVFDISSETIRTNRWNTVEPYSGTGIQLYTSDDCGCNSGEEAVLFETLDFSSSRANGLMFKTKDNAALGTETESAEEEAEEGAVVRKTFLESLAWEPMLRSDENGEISFEFRTSDKLSTYCIQLFAHDKQMHNSVLRHEFLVSLPVQINISRPQYLYEGDIFIANIEIQNNSDKDISGIFRLDFGKGEKSEDASIPAGRSYRFSQEIIAEKTGELVMNARFIDSAGGMSDAMQISIPVKEAAQTISEAHSMLIKAGADREYIQKELSSRFVNVSPAAAKYEEISIIDMLRRELPAHLECSSDNSIALSESLLADHILRGIEGCEEKGLDISAKSEVTRKLLACRKSDGGFAWFAGMRSSVYATAAVLENMAAMRDGLTAELADLIPDALMYMHKKCKTDNELYLYMRALYADVKLPKAEVPTRVMRKYANETRRGILAKSRKIFILKTYGYDKQASAELESLTQYAVSHSSGGVYFPNAVMPWRGLMESELHAHTLICRVLDSYGYSELAEGLRLWMMVQKESQQWGSDPAFIAAAATILDGRSSTLETKIAVLKAEDRLPFGQIAAGGNGFTIKRSYFRNGKQLKKGDILRVGDKIKARYELWSEENRSFVRASIPRPASLQATQQLSGMQGYGIYRSVEADASIYWIDNYPEETMSIEEEFMVVQEGSFNAGAATIESLYAPHYRANSDPVSTMRIER